MVKLKNPMLRKNNLIIKSFQEIANKNQKLNLMGHCDYSPSLKTWISSPWMQ